MLHLKVSNKPWRGAEYVTTVISRMSCFHPGKICAQGLAGLDSPLMTQVALVDCSQAFKISPPDLQIPQLVGLKPPPFWVVALIRLQRINISEAKSQSAVIVNGHHRLSSFLPGSGADVCQSVPQTFQRSDGSQENLPQQGLRLFSCVG